MEKWPTYEVNIKHPNGFIGKTINMNFSKDAAVDVALHGIGMENDEAYVNACEVISVIEVIEDPNNPYHYIPKEK